MKRSQLLLGALGVSLVVWGVTPLDAAEHPGTATKEHAGTEHAKEHAGTTVRTQAASTPVAPGVTSQPTMTQVMPAQPIVTQEVAGKTAEPTHEEIRIAMKSYALEMTSQHGGFFPIHDDRTGKNRKLTFERVHERVGKLSTRDGYFSCADFVDQESGEPLDVDF